MFLTSQVLRLLRQRPRETLTASNRLIPRTHNCASLRIIGIAHAYVEDLVDAEECGWLTFGPPILRRWLAAFLS